MVPCISCVDLKPLRPVLVVGIRCGVSPSFLAIALQKSCFISIAVHLPMPNCRPVDLYVSPVANRHNAIATLLFTGIDWRNLVSSFAKSGPTNRTMYSNVRLDILKFSFHQSSTIAPCKRFSNQNWFLGHDHARLARRLFWKAIWRRINRLRLDLLRCCKSNCHWNLEACVCCSRTRKWNAMTTRATASLLNANISRLFVNRA